LNLKKTLFLGILFGLVLVGLFGPFVNQFYFPFASQYSDLTISHYPNAVYFKNALAVGQFPYWSDLILGGYPFASNPLSGVWYVPGWLALLFLPSPTGFNLVFLCHLLGSGLGMFLFLRRTGRSYEAALPASLGWMLMPKVVAHFAAGHISLVYAVCWLPWVFWATTQKFYWRLFYTSLFLGLTLLADVRWGAYTLIAFAAYSAYSSFFEHRQKYPLKLVWASLVYPVLIAIGLSSVVLLPLGEFTALSTRMSMSGADSLYLSLEPGRLFGLLMPDMIGGAEWMTYFGVTAIASLVVVVTRRKNWRMSGFWVFLWFVAVFWALGEAIPWNAWLAQLPGFNLMRVPPRALLLGGFALAVCTSIALDDLLSIRISKKSKEKNISLQQRLRWLISPQVLLVGLGAFSSLISVGVWKITGHISPQFLWGTTLIILTAGVFVFRLLDKMPVMWFWGSVIILVVFDLGTVDYLLARHVSANDVFGEGQAVSAYLKTQPGVYRVYSPAYSIPQHTAALAGLELAQGIDPLQLKRYSNWLIKASAVPAMRYSVILPPLATGDVKRDNQDYLPDIQQLGRFNVCYLVAPYEIKEAKLVKIKVIGDQFVYQNPDCQPRAIVKQTDLIYREAKLVQKTPNEVLLAASGPGELILAEVFYPGWGVEVDGQSAKMTMPEGFMRGVQLDEGQHQVRFVFQPVFVYWGEFLSLLSVIGLGALFFYARREQR
jgi:hypothetical protein